MAVRIPNLLTAEELAHLTHCLATADFIDGKLTAGWHARSVKQNQQLPQAASTDALKGIILTALDRSPLFQAIAAPA